MTLRSDACEIRLVVGGCHASQQLGGGAVAPLRAQPKRLSCNEAERRKICSLWIKLLDFRVTRCLLLEDSSNTVLEWLQAQHFLDCSLSHI